jgi:DNA-binding CsgD family transcriptional regulator
MDVGEILNQILGLIYFLAGLAVGLWRLHTAQRQFEAQQNDKMTQLQASIADIQQRLAALQLVNSERSFNMQDKLLELATARAVAVQEITDEAANDITNLVKAELERAGVQNVVSHLADLEDKINTSLAQTTSSVLEVAASNPSTWSAMEREMLRLLALGRSPADIARELHLSFDSVHRMCNSIIIMSGTVTPSELIDYATEHGLLLNDSNSGLRHEVDINQMFSPKRPKPTRANREG